MTAMVLVRGDQYTTRGRGVAEYRGYDLAVQLETGLVWMLINENRFFRTLKSGRCQHDNESEEDVEGLPSTFTYHPADLYKGPKFLSKSHKSRFNRSIEVASVPNTIRAAKGDIHRTRSRGGAIYQGNIVMDVNNKVFVWWLMDEERLIKTNRQGRCDSNTLCEEDVIIVPPVDVVNSNERYTGRDFVTEMHPVEDRRATTQEGKDEEHTDNASISTGGNDRGFHCKASGIIMATNQITIDYNGQEYVIAVDSVDGPGRGNLVLRTADLKRLCIEPAAANSVNFSVREK